MPTKRKPILSPGKPKSNAQYSIRDFKARKKTDNRLSPQKKISYNRFESLAQEELDEDQPDDSSTSSSSTCIIDNTMAAAASSSIVSTTTEVFDIDSITDFPSLSGKMNLNKSREDHSDIIVVGGNRADISKGKRADKNKGATDNDSSPLTPDKTVEKNIYEPPSLRRETETNSTSIASTSGGKLIWVQKPQKLPTRCKQSHRRTRTIYHMSNDSAHTKHLVINPILRRTVNQGKRKALPPKA
jgi:hypothetical protein